MSFGLLTDVTEIKTQVKKVDGEEGRGGESLRVGGRDPLWPQTSQRGGGE